MANVVQKLVGGLQEILCRALRNHTLEGNRHLAVDEYPRLVAAVVKTVGGWP